MTIALCLLTTVSTAHNRAPVRAPTTSTWQWQQPVTAPAAPARRLQAHTQIIAHKRKPKRKPFVKRSPPARLLPAEPAVEPADATEATSSPDVQEARTYLLGTARPGYTMLAQGVERALSCLHPIFVVRLAAAILDARLQDIPAAIFSACRPPMLRVGGFANKFRSMHAYGLAVDMAGIGEAGSAMARRWHDIAERHKVYGVYGAAAPVEWNHYQATRVLAAPTDLQQTITAAGPRTLGGLYKAALGLIDRGPRVQTAEKPHHRHGRHIA